MRVVYETMLGRVKRAVSEATEAMRTIGHIEMSPDEFKEFVRELYPESPGTRHSYYRQGEITYHGTRIVRV